MIIDIHTHIFPEDLAERALKRLSENAGIEPCIDGTCEALLASMKEAEIEKSAVMPVATKPSQVHDINSWVSWLPKEHDELIAFGTIHPKQEDWQDEIAYMVEEGFPGVKLHPDYQEFFVDDPELMPIYRALADAELIVMFHAGVDVGLPPPVHCTPERLAHVLDAVPDLTIIAAHMGGYNCWDDVERHLVGRNIYFDTSFSFAALGADRMTKIIREHGVESILFGTDSPWTDQKESVAALRSLPLTDSEINAILGNNASRLLYE